MLNNKPSNHLDHYEITEQKVLDDEPLKNDTAGENNQPKLQLTFLDHPTSFARGIVGVVILVLALIFGLIARGDGSGIISNFECAGIIMIGLVAAFAIITKKI